VFLTDIADFDDMNAVYVQSFDVPYPARTTVAVVALPLGARVEMDFVVR
jgi:2-iminobutanoate/2-iminopropanoate deaminase